MVTSFNNNVCISCSPENAVIVQARTVLTESSLNSGRAQPSEAPLCASYSNEKTKQRASRKRKASAAPTVLEYNLHRMPRILKNDLRRQYPAIFTNVFNACDANQMRLMLKTFARPDIRNIMQFSGKRISLSAASFILTISSSF